MRAQLNLATVLHELGDTRPAWWNLLEQTTRWRFERFNILHVGG